MKRRSTDTSEAPARERRRLGRSLPVLAGAAIAAVGLTVGSLTAASAAAGHGGPPSIEQQAAKVKAQDAFTPKNGNAEMNVTVLEDQIKHYYGSASATFPVVGTVTVPSPSSNYAKQMQHIVARAEGFLAGAIHHQHGKGKPAVVFDIDDTLLNTYDYEIANQFGFTPASNAVFVNAAAFPAVFYMPRPGQLRGQPRLRGLLHHRPAADPDGRHGHEPDQRRLPGPPGRAPVPQAGHAAVLPALRQRADLHDDRVQVRHPRAHRQRGLLDHGGLRRPVQRPARR